MVELEEVIAHTMRIQSLLEDHKDSSHRDQTIEAIQVLLDKRAELIPTLKTPVSVEEKRLTKELLHINKETQKKMNVFLKNIKQDMQTNKLQRKSNQSYMNPYNDVQVADGMYVDKKN